MLVIIKEIENNTWAGHDDKKYSIVFLVGEGWTGWFYGKSAQ